MMARIKSAKDRLAGKAKRFAGEILGDQKLHDQGEAQEQQGREEAEEPVKPLGNLDQLT